MRVVIATGMSNDPEVHRLGCNDVARGLKTRKYTDTWVIEVAKLEDAALEFWSDIIAESDDEDEAAHAAVTAWTVFLPCTKSL